MIKLLHIADCHLDSSLAGLPSFIADTRRQQIQSAFFSALTYGAKNGADIILIAGDLFDTPTASRSGIDMLIGFANENPNCRIFITPGNHDCVIGNNYIEKLSAVENITVFSKGSIEKVKINELNLCVYGVGCIHPHSEEMLLKDFWVDDLNCINILCFHGLLQGYGGHAPYNPLTRDNIAQSGLDYIALGHVHAFSGIQSLGLVNYAYSGCPIGRGFDETGKKGFIFGEVEKGSCRLQFVETEYPTFERVFVDCSGAQTQTDIITRVQAAVEPIAKNCYLSVVLEGFIRSDLVINRGVVKNLLEGYIYSKVYDKTEPEQNYMSLCNEQTLKGIFIKKVLESGADENTVQKAITLGLASLSGEELNMDEY